MTNEEIFQTVSRLMCEQLNIEESSVSMETSFEEVEADSVDMVELVMGIEEAFDMDEIADSDLEGMKTVGDLVGYIAGKVND